MTPRVVLDTNIIVSGFGWGGVPGHVLDAAFDGRFVVVTSVALLREVGEVIARSKFAKQFPAPEAFIDLLSRTSRITDPPPRRLLPSSTTMTTTGSSMRREPVARTSSSPAINLSSMPTRSTTSGS